MELTFDGVDLKDNEGREVSRPQTKWSPVVEAASSWPVFYGEASLFFSLFLSYILDVDPCISIKHAL